VVEAGGSVLGLALVVVVVAQVASAQIDLIHHLLVQYKV
jgi:hypothetical protein